MSEWEVRCKANNAKRAKEEKATAGMTIKHGKAVRRQMMVADLLAAKEAGTLESEDAYVLECLEAGC